MPEKIAWLLLFKKHLWFKKTPYKLLQMYLKNCFKDWIKVATNLSILADLFFHGNKMYYLALKKSYDQLKSWMECHHVTDPSSLLPVTRPFHVNWLGGLTNPEAILYALKFHKAIEENCDIDEVRNRFPLNLSYLDTVLKPNQNMHRLCIRFWYEFAWYYFKIIFDFVSRG